ncbi:prolyl oligopeptidase family serine peptidase [Peristeroidobacter soli]|jgi:dipeptidyl aminopeptidase/acylaminoacyl peptidase|uniref:prolyl oligopeptidase family serine peptidase n=1 Tax=Peristeroidobacter soli TaxID=2497877 RepID=UPI00101D081D|nr:prolyl oligopeptidase family serine peptidase [Peristeroidobacter soli]
MMRTPAGVAILSAIALCSLASLPALAEPQAQSRIALTRTRSSTAPAPITLDEIVSLREFREPQLSPDGRQVAFVVKQAFRDCDCYRAALYLADVSGGAPRKLIEEEEISGLHWMRDGQALSFLSTRGGSKQLWRTSLNGTVTPLIQHRTTAPDDWSKQMTPGQTTPIGVIEYVASPDGRCIAFTARSQVFPVAGDEHVRAGVLYDDRNMSMGSLYHQYVAQLFVHCLDSQAPRLLWQTTAAQGAAITLLRWAPDAASIAFAFEGQQTKSDLGAGVALLEMNSGQVRVLSKAWDVSESHDALAWSNDGARLAVMHYQEMLQRRTLSDIDIASGRETQIRDDIAAQFGPFLQSAAGFVVELTGTRERRAKTGLYHLSGDGSRLQRLSSEEFKVSDCGVVVGTQVACIVQSPNLPPRLAIVDLRSGKQRVLKNVLINPDLDTATLTHVQELRWRNRSGLEATGYLLTPTTQRPESGYPLLVMAYNFNGEFVTAASAQLTSYPAQPLSERGIAVLLINGPRVDQGVTGSSGLAALALEPLATLEAAIERLAGEGLIDRDKVGFTGHSWGGFWVQFAITERPDLIRVAGVLNGGSLAEPGTYWYTGKEAGRIVQEHYWGGPPYPPTLDNYIARSPALRTHRVRAPVLVEADAFAAHYQMEMYAALRARNVPVELYVYPAEGHSFYRPEHRFYSMQRNLDWFSFWLLDREDDDAAKVEQYARWRVMKQWRR